MKYIKYLTSLLLLLQINMSCKKFIEPTPPVDKLSSAIVFKDEATATSAVLGIYSNMMSITPFLASGAVTIYTGLSSDELYNTNISSVTQSEFASNAISAGNSVVSTNFWQEGFNIIYHANACIEGLDNNTYLPVSVKNQLLGESYFNRAFIYYFLVSLFGDIPLILKTDYLENQGTARTASTSVHEQIITDLKRAQELLSPSYATNERIRANKWAATALLARIYLALGQWSSAEQESSSIIDNSNYSLEQDLNNVFIASSNEAIWQIMPIVEGFNTTEGYSFIPSNDPSIVPAYALTDFLINSFEPGDLRKNHWVNSKAVQGHAYYYPFKYKIGEYGKPLTEYYMVFRLAEQYLIRAESFAHQGKVEESKGDLNIIRARVGLPNTAATTIEELNSAIFQERRIELFAEWGHRWFDLKRTQKSTEILGPIKPGWQPTDTLYPIPLRETLRNPSLTQNQGY